MSSLSSFRTAILALLSDASNAIFSNDNIDQALRWALSEYSTRRPLLRTYMLDVEISSCIHYLPDDFATRHITKVELYNEDPDSIIELTHYAYKRDEQWVVGTSTISAGEVLQITYSTVHTIDGLDSAAGTTVLAEDEPLLHTGAAGRAAQMRALDRIETINMNKDVVAAYRQLAAEYLNYFAGHLTIIPGVTISPLPSFPEIKF